MASAETLGIIKITKYQDDDDPSSSSTCVYHYAGDHGCTKFHYKMYHYRRTNRDRQVRGPQVPRQLRSDSKFRQVSSTDDSNGYETCTTTVESRRLRGRQVPCRDPEHV
ncbi:hypothetical protein VPH35_066092 [Triticum aestivum]